MNNNKKMTRKTKDEKRRLAFEKRNVKKEMNLARFGAESGSALVMAKTTDFNRRLVAAFMALVFAISCIVIGVNFAARADDPVPAQTSDDNSNLVLEKTLSAESDGTYTLQLSAYAKGKIKDVTEQIPTDFVLVLDQSGSMKTVDMPTSYVAANNGNRKDWRMSDFENQALYIKDEAQENTYYRVYRKRGVMYEYQEPDSIYVKEVLNKLRWFQGETEQEQSTASQYYFRPSDVDPNPEDGSGITLTKNGDNVNVSDDDSFYHVDITSNGKAGYYAIKFSYDSKDGNTYYFVHPNEPIYKSPFGGKYKPGDLAYSGINDVLLWYFGDNRCYSYATLGVNSGMYIRQPLYIRHASYSQLCYKDSNGVEHKLINTPYCDSDDNPLGGACNEQNDGKPTENQTSTTQAYWNGVLYQPAENSTEERLLSLNKALKAFVDATAEQTDDYGKVDHRIAMVGFSSPGYNNTELLTGVPINSNNSMPSGGSSLDGYQHNGPQYSTSSSIQDSVYKTTLLSTTNEEDLDELNNAVDYITAYGGTQPALGLEMAKKIIDNREVTTYTRQSTQTTEPRRTVVIFFTDGTPGDYSTVGSDEFSNQYQEADKVVKAAYSIKSDPSTDTSIYSIGVFGESDGNPLMYHKDTTDWSSKKANLDEALDDSMTADDFSPYLAQVYVATRTSGSAGSWTNPLRYQSKRYYYFREHAEGVSGYPEQPNDTIADYMETVSSKYPEAQSFVYYDNQNQYSSYNSRIDAARGTKVDTSQRYYFMASDSASLSKVFTELSSSISESGVGLDLNETNSFLQDVISDNFVLPSNPVAHVTAQTFVGNQNVGETMPLFDTEPSDTISTEFIHFDNNTLKVYGFNYSDEYIAEGKPGKKLVVTITGLVPNKTGENLASNSSTSGIMHNETVDETTTTSTVAEFTTPTISRYKYVLHVGESNSTATFDTVFNLVPEEGKTPADKSIVFRNGSAAKRYDEITSGQISATSVGNENTTYVEYITSGGKDGNANPDDYTLNAAVSTSDTAYTYYLSNEKFLYGDDQKDENELSTVSPLSLKANDNGNLYVTSKANNHNVTIKNETVKSSEQDEDYSDPTKKFPIRITLTKTDTNAPDITSPISGVTFTNGVGVVNLANEEEVTFTLPVGYTIKVEDESDPSAYSTTYKLDADPAADSPTITNTSADHTIVVRHERDKDTIATTGVTDEDSSNSFIYILVGAGALSAGAGAAYVYRKKDEFVKR